ncbi:hypothetical protein J3R30DRAFT_3679165 [Lentinula aciculospora]|uniref:Uncharacterized protein n=1 Tax=Lentinula aciculospora TaxID=153920 RepID=A0A9W9DYC3_9AGAR|nr:hypothetical protein J3R30DRAFT_3679165 [Lentinula aciculospora]
MSTGENDVAELSTRCQKIVKDGNAARQKLQAERLSDAERQSYLVQILELTLGVGEPVSDATQGNRERTPEGLDETQREEFRSRREEILRGRGENSGRGGGNSGERDSEGVDPVSGVANLGGGLEVQSSESNALAQQLRAIHDSGQPSHLRKKATSSEDPHIDKTLRTKRIYPKKPNSDTLNNLFQARHLLEPLLRSVWRLILKDEYVSFEKLLTGIDPRYDHRDEGKDFGAGYALVKKDFPAARKPITSESEWNKVFETWKTGVVEAFPHRMDELTNYGNIISNLARTQAAVMGLVHHASGSSKEKRSLEWVSPGGERLSKRSNAAICLNWNGARRGFVWGDSDADVLSLSVLFLETAGPLPDPPLNIVDDPKIQLALLEHRDFLRIHSPYDVEKLSTLLHFHPNRLFVESETGNLEQPSLCQARKQNPGSHPIWQIKQVVKVDSNFHIIHQLIFGGQPIPQICLHVYMDDFFGWDFLNNLVFFRGCLHPKQQVQLLLFWDYIGCPYKDAKQDDGICLKIIGFFIDINTFLDHPLKVNSL